MDIRTSFDALFTRLFFREKSFALFEVASLLGNLFQWALIALSWDTIYQPSREFINLHYKVFVGVDFYSSWYYIFFLPLFGCGALILNYCLSRWIYPFERTLAFLAAGATCILQYALAFALFLIIQINVF